MGDVVCASKGAFFLQAFARIGLIPDGGSTWMLPRLVGWGRAMELSLLAERLPAEQAHEWGLVNRLFDDNEALLAGAMDIARKLANGPRSLTLIRKAYWATWQNAFEQQLRITSYNVCYTKLLRFGFDSVLQRESRHGAVIHII